MKYCIKGTSYGKGFNSVVDGENFEGSLEEVRTICEANKPELTWIENRIKNYGSLEKQQDLQYWDLINGTTIWQDHITAVKLQFPKPEEA